MTAPRRLYTFDEYLALDATSERPCEYVDGHVVPRLGASMNHVRVVGNIVRELGTLFRRGACEVFSTNLRVRAATAQAYFYPDVAALCGHAEVEQDRGETLLNPSVVIEVLSDSTESYDRGLKFSRYAQVPSLCEYVLIAQREPRVERFVPSGADWTLTILTGMDDVLALPSVGAALRLRDVYERVEFPDGPPRPRLIREPAGTYAGEPADEEDVD